MQIVTATDTFVQHVTLSVNWLKSILSKSVLYREQFLLSLEGHDFRANNGSTGVQSHDIAHNRGRLPLIGHHACNLYDRVLVWLREAALHSTMLCAVCEHKRLLSDSTPLQTDEAVPLHGDCQQLPALGTGHC